MSEHNRIAGISRRTFLKKSTAFVVGGAVFFLSACKKGNKEQLPVDFVWDRVVCEECKMALSDPHYSAQVIDPDGQPYYFDDIGCAILWLRRQPWRKKARTWVNDVYTTEWIDAEKANWIYGDPKTPMGYGFAATMMPVKNPMKFSTVKKWMYIGKTLVRENTAKHLGLENQSPVTVGPAYKGKTSDRGNSNRKRNEQK